MKDIITLAEELQSIRNDILALQKSEALIKDGIVAYYKDQLKQFGAKSFKEDKFKFTINTPKYVKWDQKGLKKLLEEGAPVDAKYTIKESVFNEQPDECKAILMPHRTVTPGKTAVKVEFICDD